MWKQINHMSVKWYDESDICGILTLTLLVIQNVEEIYFQRSAIAMLLFIVTIYAIMLKSVFHKHKTMYVNKISKRAFIMEEMKCNTKTIVPINFLIRLFNK